MDLAEILLLDNIQSKVSALKEKSVIVPEWGKLLVDYEPMKHAILDDKQTRIDKVRSDGTVEKASRIVVGLEKLLTKRVNEFTFAIPVRRIYSNTEDNEMRQQIARALEMIFKYARIDSENIRRGLAYYACC